MNHKFIFLYFLATIPFTVSCKGSDNPIDEELKKEIRIINGQGVMTPITGYMAQDYSGIAWLEDNRYVMVTDKKDGFYEFTFNIQNDGSVGNISRSDFCGDSLNSRDCEDVIFHPHRKTLFIPGEQDQEILEYTFNGSKTGSRLSIPEIFRQNQNNYGFEALGYDPVTNLFWTTTEATLKNDGEIASSSNPVSNLHRIQSFNGTTLEPQGQYAYRADNPEGNAGTHMSVVGVPAVTALRDGRLFVLEREFFVGNGQDGDLDIWAKNKIFLVDPEGCKDVSGVTDLRTLDENDFITKQKLWERKTEMADTDSPLANFEGMCLGPVLPDGSHTLILINDSQGGMMSLLKEYLLVLKFEMR